MKKFIIVCCVCVVVLPLEVVNAGRGCCSWHGGESSSCTTTGRRICNDGTISPSCTCTPSYVYGCTDRLANNYNSRANKDDGSCTYTINGCMNNSAINYNSNANSSDGSCQFEEVITNIEKVKYKTIYKNSSKIKYNKLKVKKKGQNGKVKITYKIVKDENGNEISRKILMKKTIKKKINKIILKGTKKSKKL